MSNPIAKKAMEGWQLAGNVRIQTGTPLFLTPPTGSAGFGTFNQYSDGVIYHNMTQADLQAMVGNYKSTSSTGIGLVTYLPDSVINNTKAAFAQGRAHPCHARSECEIHRTGGSGPGGLQIVYLSAGLAFLQLQSD